MKKITFCIPSKNNLRYLRHSITSILENSTYENDIIVYVDSDNDGTKEWLKQKGINYLENESSSPKGIAYAYNRCIEAANTELVCMFHADMYMAKGFDANLLKHLKENTVVSATRIEPPLHPKGLEKIVENFGMYPEDFQKETFERFCEKEAEIQRDKVTYGIFAPWLIRKSDIVEIGLHDERFHSYQEDSDIFNRMLLNGMTCVQSRDSFVYHFTCRGGQFQDGIEKVTDDPAFHRMKDSALKNYIRKWGCGVKNNEYQHPILYPKYNIGYVIHNCAPQHLKFFECWAESVYCDLSQGEITNYISEEQKNTSFDMNKRVFLISENKSNDVLVEFDCRNINQNSVNMLMELPLIIRDSGSVGEFELDAFKITIHKMDEHQNKLIKSNSDWYTDKLKK